MRIVEYDNGRSFTRDEYIRSPDCDVPLLRKHVEWVRLRDGWDQTLYARADDAVAGGAEFEGNMYRGPLREVTCGSAFCLAGNVAFQEGVRFLMSTTWNVVTHVLTADGTIEEIGEYARNLLGITDDAAAALFAPGNTLDEIGKLATIIAGEPI